MRRGGIPIRARILHMVWWGEIGRVGVGQQPPTSKGMLCGWATM